MKNQNGIKANALLITPESNKIISRQISKTIISGLLNPKILCTEYFQMYISSLKNPVRAKADGTYCYGARDPELAAVSVFLSLTKQMELYLDLGLRKPKRPLSVIINDPFVPDNAQFQCQNYELHIGIGTGVQYGGLVRNMVYDLGVANHEFGHALVYLQTLGSDLPGKQGAAMHEAIADVLGTLVMDYLSRIWYAREQFTLSDLQNDPRIIGKYAVPPFGMRSHKNRKRLEDIVGEAHEDGLIVGGALADLLVAMASQPNTILEDQIKLFCRMNLVALSLFTDLKANFKNLLRALIIADKHICLGKYRPVIEQCFSAHGIIFNTTIPTTTYNKNLRIIQ